MPALPVSPIAVGFLVLTGLALPAAAATESVLYDFTDICCGYPQGHIFFANESLYGTGFGDPNGKGDYGQVFKLTKSGGAWKEKSMLVFDEADGAAPNAGLIRDSSGAFFGTASLGDAYNGGNVFELHRSGGKWVSSTIWAFGGTADDGTLPECDLVMDKSGNLYGTTFEGGLYGAGTTFELSKVNGVWSEIVLHSFSGHNGDGWFPYAGLLMAGPDTFYGTTWYGGDQGGDGTVFKLFKAGGKWKEQVLYSFTGGADGGEPWGAVVSDKNGNLYGTTYYGGVSNFYSDVGTVFELVRSGNHWEEKVLHDFGGEDDGEYPIAGLTWGPSGLLYGTTAGGGTPGGPGVGTVFELARSHGSWAETVLHSFTQAGDGSGPDGEVVLDQDGALYGTTSEGGADNLGAVWEITT